MDTLENIISGAGAVAPVSEPQAHEQPEPNAAVEPAPQEGAGEPGPQEGSEGDGKTVPLKALHAEREKVKRYTEQIADFEKKLSESESRWEQRLNKLVSAMQPRPQAEEAPQLPDPYADPEGFTQHQVRQAIDPLQQTLHFNNRLIAESVHGPDTVRAAVDAFDALANQGQLDPRDHQRVMASPNPMHEAVLWHKRHQVLSEIGDDPTAYREKLKAEVMAELNGGQQPPVQQPGRQAPVQLPTNLAGARGSGVRSGPEWGGPASIKDIFDRRK